jgi:hypothetical protein
MDGCGGLVQDIYCGSVGFRPGWLIAMWVLTDDYPAGE